MFSIRDRRSIENMPARFSKRKLEELRDAIYDGKIQDVQEFLRLGWSPEKPFFACNPLGIARHPKMGRLLLNLGVSPNEKFFGMPPLLEQASGGQLEMVKFLVKAGADLNVCYRKKGDVSFARGTTPLMAAISHNQIEIARFLVRSGADINLEDEYGHNALFYAARWNRTELAMELVRRRSNLPQDVLCGPVSRSNLKLLRFLIANGADPNAVFSRIREGKKYWPEGETLLGFSIRRIYKLYSKLAGCEMEYPAAIAELLIKAGADVNKPSKSICWHNGILTARPIPPLRIAGGKGLERIMNLLWKAGAKGTIQEAMADCTLERAAYRHSPAIVRLLIKAGADVNEVGRESGKRPIELAREKGDTEIVQLLKMAGAKDL